MMIVQNCMMCVMGASLFVIALMASCSEKPPLAIPHNSISDYPLPPSVNFPLPKEEPVTNSATTKEEKLDKANNLLKWLKADTAPKAGSTH